MGIRFCCILGVVVCALAGKSAAQVAVDPTHYSEGCGVQVRQVEESVVVRWPTDETMYGELVLDLRVDRPLIKQLGLAEGESAPSTPLLLSVEPTVFLTVGTREAPPGRPPQMSIWNVFFDKPASRPYRTYTSRLARRRVTVSSSGRRATVSVSELTMGSFSGELAFTCYAGCPLVHVEAVLSTTEDRRAILYDTALIGQGAGWRRFVWHTTEGRVEACLADEQALDRPLAVRHRMLAAECEHGSVVCLPPPHQYQFPRDWTDNLGFVWLGRGHAGQDVPFGFGVRQVPDGGRAFEPWFNAPPGTKQRLGVFYLLSASGGEQALEEGLRFTRGDRFAPLPGHITFTSHYHMAVAVTAMEQKAQTVPEFVNVFKQMGVNAVHLADFHGDGHQKDPGPLRLPELEMLFRECARLSDEEFLLIPGEEVNEFLGLPAEGRHPGHWMSLFPRPVYWVMQRRPGEPFIDEHPLYGPFYRVGSREDMIELVRREQALVWAAHPRIKASSWTPDVFRHEDFYLADFWVGGAWKAMPADLSRERLGERALDLLDDMANWGQKKYVLGEVDVFKIDHTHELFGHMNVNYVRLERLPNYYEGWQSLVDALQHGRFFVTTGEVLIGQFTVDGRQSGETVELAGRDRVELRATLEWTFPLKFAEVISGDGQRVYRERIDLADSGPFGRRTLVFRPTLAGRTWVRFEVWDVAANGAFTQPVWITGGK